MDEKERTVIEAMKKEGKPMRPGDISKKAALDKTEVTKIIDKLKKEAQFPEARELITIDGMRVEYADGALLDMAETKLELGRRTPSPERLAWASQVRVAMGERTVPKDQPEVYALEQFYLAETPRRELRLQALRIGPAEREEIRHREYVERIIDFLEIQAWRKTPVGRLPYGLQKRVDLGRALAMEPQVLLLDEPMAGMNVEEKQDMSRFILDVNDEYGTTVVLIEHDMSVVMDISDRVVVLDYGKKIGDGTPHEVRNNENVIAAYLGVAH